jgi:hypothetical protein
VDASTASRSFWTSPSTNAGVFPSVRENLSVLTFPGRIHGEYAFFSEPGKQHSDGGQILFDGLTVGLDPGTSQKTASKPVRKQPECSGVNVGFGD